MSPEYNIVTALSAAFKGGRITVTPSGYIRVRSDPWDNGYLEWPDVTTFLFGTPERMSFFELIMCRDDRLSEENSWLRSLEDCSSVEELELKMTVMGLPDDGSRKTLERESE